MVKISAKHILKDEKATLALGARLAAIVPDTCVIYLHGELGAGKTTLVRGFLRALGHKGKVKSPTFTLVEPYQITGKHIYHFDLYRLVDPEELEYVGMRDYVDAGICLIEWPERGVGFLPPADLHCFLDMHGKGRIARFEFETEKLLEI
jgi:tRNA threonylcarbamoyladenosine biosynthesis protein TsaE